MLETQKKIKTFKDSKEALSDGRGEDIDDTVEQPLAASEPSQLFSTSGNSHSLSSITVPIAMSNTAYKCK